MQSHPLASGEQRNIQQVGIVGLCAVAVAHGLSYGLCVQDDTFISLRYAVNLVRGHGLVYNVGERVEGYTNFLWTLFLAAVAALGGNPLLAAVYGGILSAVGLVFLVWRLGARGQDGWIPLVAPAVVALLPGFLLEAAQGLETAFFAFLVAGGLWATLREEEDARRFPRSSLWFAVAALTRPEGLLLYIFVQVRVALKRRTWLGWVLFTAVVAGHLAFRWSYYGLLLPNTFYAKTGGGVEQWIRGLRYVASFAGSHPVLVAAALMGAGGLVWRTPRSLRTWLLVGTTLVYLLYVVSVGGDFKPTWRFVMPVLGPLAVLVQEGVGIVDRGIRRAWVLLVVLAALVGLLDLRGTFVRMHAEARFRAGVMDDLLTVGLFLRDHTSPDTVIAMHSAGTVPYASGLYTLDMWGITNAHIARQEKEGMGQGMAGHEKTDPDWVFGKSPSLYLPEEDLLTVAPVRLPVPADFPSDFESRYQPFSIRVGDRWLNLFRRIQDPVVFLPDGH